MLNLNADFKYDKIHFRHCWSRKALLLLDALVPSPSPFAEMGADLFFNFSLKLKKDEDY